MPNNKKRCPNKPKIDKQLDQSIADIDTLLTNPQAQSLTVELTTIKTSLQSIKGDPHHAQ